jgi:hypothetical protein
MVLVASSAVLAAGVSRDASVVSGIVRDQQGSPLEGVRVHAKGAHLSDVSTNSKGWFRFAVVEMPGEIPLRFSRSGFEDTILTVQAAEAEIELNVVMASRNVEISMTDFESGQRIRGTVDGLAPEEREDFKVLVYVLTNKWYIHPEAVATPGRGFADIGPDGRWEIRTVWRGYQATKLAILVVPKDAWAPPTVEPEEVRPEDALSLRLKPQAMAVLEAPDGI